MTEDLARQAGGVQFAGGGTPETSEPAQPNQPGGAGAQTGGTQQQQPQYVTMDQVQQILKQELDRYRDSITDRTANRVQKIIQQAAQRGVQLDPAQARAVIETIDSEAQAQANVQQPQQQPQQGNVQAQPAQPPNQQHAQPQQATPENIHPVVLAADDMMQRAGVFIEPDDPELALIDQKTDDPVAFLSSVKQAIAAKQQRQQAKGSPARMPALTAQGAPGNPVTGIKDPSELWKLAMQQEGRK